MKEKFNFFQIVKFLRIICFVMQKHKEIFELVTDNAEKSVNISGQEKFNGFR